MATKDRNLSKDKSSLRSLLKRINKPLASLKLAVFIIISLATVTSIGTFVEAKFDAYAAKKLVYDTWFMYAIMGTLVVNLIAVMIDRLPWKKRHVAFVLAHIGIIVLLGGSVLTWKYGLDGSMRVGIGESNNLVQTAETDVTVYTSFDGDRYTKTLETEVDFFRNPPTDKKPFVVPALDQDIRIADYKKYVVPTKKVSEGVKGKSGAGVRFQLQNANVNVIEWLVQRNPKHTASMNFGPATVYLGEAPIHFTGENEVYLTPKEGGMDYVVYQKDLKKPLKKGFVKEGDVFDPGYKMALSFRVLRYMDAAVEEWDFQELAAPTPMTTAAVKVVFNGKDHWVMLNDMVKLFTENSVYLITYGNRRIDINFPIKLKSFNVSRYQGTMRAAAYESVVEVPDVGEVLISMNEPLKFRGLTIYQASFQEENGQPVASIFSVNHDPGRFLKYLGSLILSVGIVLLMWFKHLDFKLARKTQAGE